MNEHYSLLDAAIDSEHISPRAALLQFEWQSDDSDNIKLQTGQGTAELCPLPTCSGWQRFLLIGPMVASPRGQNVFVANTSLRLPAKFFATGDKHTSCCVELPDEWFSDPASQFEFSVDPTLLNPTLAWARALTTFLMGHDQSNCRHSHPQAIVDALQQMSWSASLDDQQIHVHLQLPSIYRQVTIDLEATGFRVRADLIEIDSLSEDSKRAIWVLAGQANRRLPLVRYALRADTTATALSAEVFMNVALIPGGWLFAAMHAVETAVAMTALELEALRDPEFAEWFMAARERGTHSETKGG